MISQCLPKSTNWVASLNGGDSFSFFMLESRSVATEIAGAVLDRDRQACREDHQKGPSAQN